MRRILRRLGGHGLLIVAALLFVGPFIYLLATSLKPSDQPVFSFPPDLIPRPPVLDSFVEAWTRVPFARYLLNSVLLVVLTVPVYMAVSALAAYPLARMRFRGRTVAFVAILSTMFLPGEVMLVPRFLVITELRLVDTFAGVVLPGLLSAFGVFLLRQSFAQIPRELEDAARLDGAGDWRTFWNVMLPQVKPAMATLAIFGFVSVWNNFVWPLVVLRDEDKYPISLGLSYLTGLYGFDIRALAAGTVIAMLPVILFFILAQRRFLDTTSGAVKG